MILFGPEVVTDFRAFFIYPLSLSQSYFQKIFFPLFTGECLPPDQRKTAYRRKKLLARFPDDFVFQLTKDEVEMVKSQIVTSPNSNFYSGQEGGRRKPPYAFTEQGITMLATVIKGETAERQNIFIIGRKPCTRT